MKREAVVCDLKDGGGACQRLANYVCPLCQRDVCRDHRSARVIVQLQMLWPLYPQGEGRPAQDRIASTSKANMDVCDDCFREIERHNALSLNAPSVNDLVAKTLPAAVEAYGADLAAAKLAKQR